MWPSLLANADVGALLLDGDRDLLMALECQAMYALLAQLLMLRSEWRAWPIYTLLRAQV